MPATYTYFNFWLLFIPLIAAIAGWTIVRLFLWILFKPAQPVMIAGFKLQGIIPSHRGKFARSIGQYAASMLDSAQFSDKINDPANFARIKPFVEDHMDDFLRNRLKEQMPMIAMFIGDKTIESLKVIFIKEIELLFPEVIRQLANPAQNTAAIAGMVEKRLAAIPTADLENKFNQQFSRAQKTASAAGFVIGLAFGMLQLLLIWLIQQ